jgi:hypothetical protein
MSKLLFSDVTNLCHSNNRIKDLQKQRDEVAQMINVEVANYKRMEKDVIKALAEETPEEDNAYVTFVDMGNVYTVRDVFNNPVRTCAKKVGKLPSKHASCEDEDEDFEERTLIDPANFERKVIVTVTEARKP